MSLLMDALKKAELAKRSGQGESAEALQTGGFGDLTLEPIADPVSTEQVEKGQASPDDSSGALPPLASHLEELDERFLAEAKQAAVARVKASASAAPAPRVEPEAAQFSTAEPSSRAATATTTRRAPPDSTSADDKAAAQNLFAAKQVEKPPARKAFAIAVGVITVLSVSGIGGYFWWQLQPKSVIVAARPPPAPATAMPAVSPAPALAVAQAASAAAIPTTTRRAPPADEAEDDDKPPVAARTPVQMRRTRAAASVPASEPDSPIRVTRAPLQVNPALIRGFDAFNNGDLALAQTEYERAQKSDPRNTDALHGLAAIAVRQGRLDQAELLYRRITEADPQDTVAISALINSRGQLDPGGAESRLKSLSAAQPELAAPHFTLGNLYARQNRWNEAQQSYFRAYSAEPDNPDLLYNLAISLEHLRQNKLAAQYYGMAIAAAQNRPAGFDKSKATARLNALQP